MVFVYDFFTAHNRVNDNKPTMPASNLFYFDYRDYRDGRVGNVIGVGEVFFFNFVVTTLNVDLDVKILNYICGDNFIIGRI